MCVVEAYSYLLETYETEILKTVGIWAAFPEDALAFRPHPHARSVVEQFEHQVLSENRWMETMLEVVTGDPLPGERTRDAFIAKYRTDTEQRLATLFLMTEEWWQHPTTFFDVTRSRAWVFTRRLLHSAHHRGQLVVYLRALDLKVPSVYGPTADTDGKVLYQFDAIAP